MELANKYYNEIYRKYEKNPDIEKFSFCKKNFYRIKTIIQLKNESLINTPLYLEAWISTLYSDKHALNLEPETEKQLIALNKKLQEIGTEFKQLFTEKSRLDLIDEKTTKIIKYINNFGLTWKIHEKRILADATFNFAEILVENSDFEGSINYFTESMRLYKNAAENAENKLEKKQLLKFVSQTNSRREKIKKIISQNMLTKSNNANDQTEKLTLHFKKLHNSIPKWIIVNPQPRALEIKKRKRSLSKEPFQFKAKKQKIDLWTIECEKILDKFKCLNIAIDLAHLSNNTKTFDERKAIAHNNYAIFLIEDLNNKEKNYSYSKKNAFLNKVVELLTKSAEIYKNLNLTEEKNNIEHCINTISASLKNILADSLSMKTQASPKKTVESISQKNLRKYQPTSERLATIFFKNLYSDNIQNTNFETTEKLPLCISKLAQTNKIR